MRSEQEAHLTTGERDLHGTQGADDGDIQPPTTRGMMRGLAPSILVNAGLTLAAYQVLVNQHVATVTALILCALIPAAWTVGSVARTRRVDALGVLSLIFIALGILASLIAGNAQFILIKESFLTGLFGLVFLGSFLLPRPLTFSFGRQFATGGDPHRIAHWEGLWLYPSFRHTQRVMTAVWGIGFVLEATARVALVFVLPISAFLLVSPLLAYGVLVGLIFWTIRYGRTMARRGRALAAEQHAPG